MKNQTFKVLGIPAEVGSKSADAPQTMAAGDKVLDVPGFLMGVAKRWDDLTAKAA